MRTMLALSLSALAAGCFTEMPTLSSDVATGDMHASLQAHDEGLSASVTLVLSGPGGGVRLVEDDRAWLGTPAGEWPLHADPGAPGSYRAAFAPGAPGVEVRLERVEPNVDARIRLSLPPATALEVPATAARSEPLSIAWEASDAEHTTTLAVSGDCLTGATRTLTADAGAYTFLPADLRSASADACDAVVTLTRASSSSDRVPPFTHTNVAATRVARAVFVSTP